MTDDSRIVAAIRRAQVAEDRAEKAEQQVIALETQRAYSESYRLPDFEMGSLVTARDSPRYSMVEHQLATEVLRLREELRRLERVHTATEGDVRGITQMLEFRVRENDTLKASVTKLLRTLNAAIDEFGK